MKTTMKLSTLALIGAFMVSGAAHAQSNKGPAVDMKSATNYNVMNRVNVNPRPAGFVPTAPVAVNGAFNENVMTVTQRVLNDKSFMLKKGQVQTVGDAASGTWQMLSDEGGKDYKQSSPNPLSYMTVGISSSLLTQVEQMIRVLDLDVRSAKVETKVYYRYINTMSMDWKGFTDKVVSNILIDSDESAEKIAELKRLAVQAWAVGECLEHKTPVYAEYQYNGPVWETEHGRPGIVTGPISVDNGLTVTSEGSPISAESFVIDPDVQMVLSPTFEFAVVAVSESAQDAEKPYLHKVKVRALQENYASWVLYADDSRGYKGIEKAPSSREYFTLGTSFCLMSQLSCAEMVYKHQGLDMHQYRAEHQFNYQVDNAMTPSATGHVDGVTTRILMNSQLSQQQMSDYADFALRMCFAGEAVLNETEMQTGVFLNGSPIK